MEEDKNLEQNLDKSNDKSHISDDINSVFCPKCGRKMIKDILGMYACWDYNCNMETD